MKKVDMGYCYKNCTYWVAPKGRAGKYGDCSLLNENLYHIKKIRCPFQGKKIRLLIKIAAFVIILTIIILIIKL